MRVVIGLLLGAALIGLAGAIAYLIVSFARSTTDVDVELSDDEMEWMRELESS